MGPWRDIADDWRFYRFVERGRGPLAPLRCPGFWVMAVHRWGHWARGVRVPLLGPLARLFYRWNKCWIGAITGVDIRAGAAIGKRFEVHTGYGIVIADGARVGDDCAVNSGACLVHAADSRGGGVPTLGRRVRIGVGAKVLGGVTVGDFVIIGANAVVTRDVADHSVAVGVPARCRPVPREFVDEYHDPDYPPRRAGLLADAPPPPAE